VYTVTRAMRAGNTVNPVVTFGDSGYEYNPYIPFAANNMSR